MRRGIRFLLWHIRQKLQAYRFNRAVNKRITQARKIDKDIDRQLKEISKHYGT